jgi:hypothetical protein
MNTIQNKLSVRFLRVAAAVALVGVVLSGATGCASSGGLGATSSPTRMSRFSAFPIDDDSPSQAAESPRVRQVGRRGYGFVGG